MGDELDNDLVPLCKTCHDLVHCYHSLGGKNLSVCTFEVLSYLNDAPVVRPKRVAQRMQLCWQIMNQTVEKTDTKPLDLAEDQEALVDAISWSNANLKFIDNTKDSDVASDILRGLRYKGWKLVRV
jgi:hypothetical protein